MRDCSNIFDNSGELKAVALNNWKEYNRTHINKKDFSCKAEKESFAMLEKVWKKFNVEDFITQPES